MTTKFNDDDCVCVAVTRVASRFFWCQCACIAAAYQINDDKFNDDDFYDDQINDNDDDEVQR